MENRAGAELTLNFQDPLVHEFLIFVKDNGILSKTKHWENIYQLLLNSISNRQGMIL
jgi:hypothetical protein